VNEGDETDSLYVLLSGRVKVFITGEDGREVVLTTMEACDSFGEVVLDGGTRSASVMTLEPCRLFVIPQGDVEGLLAANPQFARDLIERLIAKVRSLTTKVGDLALKDAYSRFVRFAEDEAVSSGSSPRTGSPPPVPAVAAPACQPQGATPGDVSKIRTNRAGPAPT